MSRQVCASSLEGKKLTPALGSHDSNTGDSKIHSALGSHDSNTGDSINKERGVGGRIGNPRLGVQSGQILNYGKLPDERMDAGKVKNKAARFTLIKWVLYNRGFSALLLRCIFEGESQ